MFEAVDALGEDSCVAFEEQTKGGAFLVRAFVGGAVVGIIGGFKEGEREAVEFFVLRTDGERRVEVWLKLGTCHGCQVDLFGCGHVMFCRLGSGDCAGEVFGEDVLDSVGGSVVGEGEDIAFGVDVGGGGS